MPIYAPLLHAVPAPGVAHGHSGSGHPAYGRSRPVSRRVGNWPTPMHGLHGVGNWPDPMRQRAELEATDRFQST